VAAAQRSGQPARRGCQASLDGLLTLYGGALPDADVRATVVGVTQRYWSVPESASARPSCSPVMRKLAALLIAVR